MHATHGDRPCFLLLKLMVNPHIFFPKTPPYHIFIPPWILFISASYPSSPSLFFFALFSPAFLILVHFSSLYSPLPFLSFPFLSFAFLISLTYPVLAVHFHLNLLSCLSALTSRSSFLSFLPLPLSSQINLLFNSFLFSSLSFLPFLFHCHFQYFEPLLSPLNRSSLNPSSFPLSAFPPCAKAEIKSIFDEQKFWR